MRPLELTPRGDVTAVVFTIGEPFLRRALASLERQTLPPAEVVRVEHVSPFHRAFNAGAARVRTAFFVHVDADMILDPTALAALRACMAPGIAVAIGGLRDPLRGSIVGVKLYRTAAVAAQACPDSISPAVDLLRAMTDAGWRTAHALNHRPERRDCWHTFGEHQPDYAPAYTFAKFRILGARYRHWRNGPSLRRMFGVLQRSGHPAAPIAQAAAAIGVFWTESRDALRAAPLAPRELARCQRLLAGGAGPPAAPWEAHATPAEAFVAAYRAGCAMVAAAAAPAFRQRFDGLAAETTPNAWAALIGLCRAIAVPAFDRRRAAADADALAALFPGGIIR